MQTLCDWCELSGLCIAAVPLLPWDVEPFIMECFMAARSKADKEEAAIK